MTFEFREHEGCFELAFEAETKEEVVLLARFGLNKTTKINSQSAIFTNDGHAMGSVVIAKRKQPDSSL